MKFSKIKAGDILFRNKPEISWIYAYYLVISINKETADVIQLQLLDSGVLNIYMNDTIYAKEDLLNYLTLSPTHGRMLLKDIFTYEISID